MRATPLLWLLALLPLQGAFQENRIEHITVVEGQNLDLHCVVAGDRRSALEWKSPSGFVIFFNNWQGLRDPRYKLINFSEDGLSIRLTNVTEQDKGLYSCFHYSVPIKIKQVNVTILGSPLKTLLEASRIRVPNKEEKVILTCFTWGHRPRPRITWLLDNGMEVFGSTKHQRGAKTCNSTSVLTVQRYSPNSAISCVIRHKALRGANVTLTVDLKDIKLITDFTQTTLDFSTTTSAKPHRYTESDITLNIKEGSTTHPSSTEATILNLNANEARKLNRTEANPSIQTPFPSTGSATLNPHASRGPGKTLNVTEGNSTAQTQSPSTDITTLNSQTTNGINLTYDGIIMKKPNILLPTLVTALLVALLIIVLLFMVKLWKAHREWKKENDVSEQNLESNRSRPNKDQHGQEKNGHVVTWKTSKKYVMQRSCMRTSKNSEESQDSSVFEKQLPCVKETDL